MAGHAVGMVHAGGCVECSTAVSVLRTRKENNMDDTVEQIMTDNQENGISRQDFLARATALGASLSLGGLLLGEGESVLAASPQRGGTFTFFTSADPLTLDPALIASWDQDVIIGNLYESLFRLSPAGNKVVPGLARAVRVSSDGKAWTFTLRKAFFHNGRRITASDFKYTLERVLNPATKSPKSWLLSNVVGAAAFTAGKANSVSGIKALDATTLQIHLTHALAPFRSMLAVVNLGVVPREDVKRYGADFGQRVVSAGPFMLSQWQRNQQLTVKAFNKYWGGRPYLDQVKWLFIQDESTRVLLFQSQKLDDTWVPPAYWNKYYGNASWRKRLNRAQTLHTEFWVVNPKKGPLGTNRLLREALAYAINMKDVILELQGRATKANGLLPPGVLGFKETSKATYRHNVAKAKALMRQAGFANGLPQPIEVILPPWNNEIKIHEIYTAQLQEIGVQLKLKPTEFGAYLQQLGSGDFTLAWGYRVADYVDPDSFVFPMLASTNVGVSGNWARYRNPKVDAWITQARSTMNRAQRVDLYLKIHRQVMHDLPYIPLFHNVWVDVTQKNVHGYVPSAMDTHMFQKVWLSK